MRFQEKMKKETEKDSKDKKEEEGQQKKSVLTFLDSNKATPSVLSFSEKNRLCSILESLLFSTPRPQTIQALHGVFKEEGVPLFHVKEALRALSHSYESENRGIVLEEVAGGYQLRTKAAHASYLKPWLKKKRFRLSAPAMEVLSIVAYQQPCLKSDIDRLRGVESGHLLRLLMEKGFVRFLKKSELPGRPMLYGTTKKFLEVFHLKNLKELPSLREIDLSSTQEKEGSDSETEETKGKHSFQSFSLEDKKAALEDNQLRKKEDEKLLKTLSERISSTHIKAKFLEEKKEESSKKGLKNKQDTTN